MSEVRAKKALGQHFLVDLNIARKICDSLGGGTSEKPCPVLEVGCGMGVLTRFLLKRTDVVTYGAEIDSESVAYLHAHYPEFTPRLMEGDFLKMDLRTLFPEGLRVIGNFPYNISSQIFFKVLENRDLIPECVGMIQKEVAVRLAEPPGSKEYGILSVLLQAWYDIEYLFTVNETVFNPPPKVKSAVVRLRRNGVDRLDCDERLFVRVVKASFGQRRKMLRNSLRAAFGDFGGAEHPFFTQRAEQLSVADFVGMQVVATVLGGYFGSRLMQNLRGEHGYTYGVGAAMVNFEREGYLGIAAQVGAEVTAPALREIYNEIERLRREPMPEEELSLVKNIMTGEVMRILDGPFGIADVTIENLLCGTNNGVIEENIRRIQAITPAEVQRLAVKYLRREDLITAVVGAVDPKHEI